MIIDANAWVGTWPFRRLTFAGAGGLAALLERTHTDLAYASPISGVFYRDCLSAVEEMLADPGWDEARMRPVAVVNPDFPGWEDDFAAMVDDMGCVAVRMTSNYHGYSLYDDCAIALVSEAQRRGLPVILTVRMQDERSHHWRMLVNPVTVDEIRFLVKQLPEGKYVLSNVSFAEVNALHPLFDVAEDLTWEMSYKPPAFFLDRAVEHFGSDRILYGSGAPLQYPESLLMTVTGSTITENDKWAILAENANRVLGGAR